MGAAASPQRVANRRGKHLTNFSGGYATPQFARRIYVDAHTLRHSPGPHSKTGIGRRMTQEDWLNVQPSLAAKLVPCPDCPSDVGEYCLNSKGQPNAGNAHKSRQRIGRRFCLELAEWARVRGW